MTNNILLQLQQIVGESYLITKATEHYTHDWRNRYKGDAYAVVKPQTCDQLQKIIILCHKNKIKIIPQGGNTSMCGAAVPLEKSPYSQIVVNLEKLNKIIAIDTQNNTIIVEAGCTLDKVINTAARNNRYFPLSMGSQGSCQIGGALATNAGGIHVLKYGMMRDLTLGLEVALANGTILEQLNLLYKNNTYIDLKHIFIGCEGTLGIITKAVLKLYPLPHKLFTGLIGVKTIAQAINLLHSLKQEFNLCAFEIIHESAQQLYDDYFVKIRLPLRDKWLILFEIECNKFMTLDMLLQVVTNEEINLNQSIITDDSLQRKYLWQIRENIPIAEKMYAIAVKHDISLPIGSIDDFLQTCYYRLSSRHPQVQVIVFGHLGDGNLHYNVLLDSDEQTLQHEDSINSIVYSTLIELHGSIAAEHGIGQLKKNWLRKTSDKAQYQLLLELKSLLDPNNLFNYGKVLPI